MSDGPKGIADHMERVTAALESGDPAVASAVDRLTALLAHVLGTVGCIVAPEAVSLGGYPLLLGGGFLENLRLRMHEEFADPPPVLQSPRGDLASSRGTVMMALDAYIDSL